MNGLSGKVAVIVGGSGGIGAASARMLAEAGAAVAIGYNSSQEKAEAVLATLPGSGHTTFNIAVDDSQSVIAAADAVLRTHGRTDILVNSAGTTRQVPHADLDGLDDLREIMALGPLKLTPREAEICASIIMGYSTEAISLNCSISINTVATHRKRAYAKLGISSQNELFLRYFTTVRQFQAKLLA